MTRLALAWMLVLSLAGCAEPRAPALSAGVSWGNRDCGFSMTPDAGGCELWFNTGFSGQDESGIAYGGIAHGHRLVDCGQRFEVCGGALRCECPPDGG